jgi:tRNA pseudouridine38-40 synthase
MNQFQAGGRTFALEVCYDGTAYAGLQVQENAVTVQGVIEDALGVILKRPVRICYAGRTDAGVHAMGQVLSVRTPGRMQPGQMQAALNALLPNDIRVLTAREEKPGFHPRYDAVKRWYRYLIDWHDVRIPFFYRYSHWVPRRPDAGVLSAYGRSILGDHDFTSFAVLEPGQNPFRSVYEWEVSERDRFVIIDIVGNAFLRKMVRTLVGTFLELERNGEPAGKVEEILQRRNRPAAGQTAYAGGLYLMKVFYR